MGKKSKPKGKTLSLKDFHNSPSVLPPPSPASTLGSTRSLGNSREIWKDSPRSVREEKKTLLQIPKQKFSIPTAPSVPIPQPFSPSPVRLVPVNTREKTNKIVMNEACLPGTSISDISKHKQLTEKIENFVDWLAGQNYNTWINYAFNSNICVKEKFCNKNILCTPLPEHKLQKTFIPQLYHLLQDYDLFPEYMNIKNNDEKDFDMKLLIKSKNDWIADFIETVTLKAPNSAMLRINQYTTMMTKIRRVQFLRSFNEQCCKDKINQHEKIDEILTEIYGTIARKADRLQKNYIQPENRILINLD